MIENKDILDKLKNIEDPDLHQDIVSLGFVKNIKIMDSKVSFDLELTTPACPVKDEFKERAQTLVKELDGVLEVDVNMTARETKKSYQKSGLANVKNIILSHHDPVRTDSELDELEPWANNILAELGGKNITMHLAREGTEFEL